MTQDDTNDIQVRFCRKIARQTLRKDQEKNLSLRHYKATAQGRLSDKKQGGKLQEIATRWRVLFRRNENENEKTPDAALV